MDSPNIGIPFVPKGNTPQENLQLGKVYRLKRGGFITRTSIGCIQVGAPPETIKDSIESAIEVPSVYCLPKKVFNRDKAITLTEVEFPIYYNFFLKNKKTIIICAEQKKKDLNKVVCASLFGPEDYNIKDDFLPFFKDEIPSIKKETSYFINYSFDDVVDFKSISKKNPIQIEEVEIHFTDDEEYLILDKKNDLTISMPSIIEYPPNLDIVRTTNKSFTPPLFGVTCLGASNGFDPLDNTSGFVFWIGGKGVMVDPPVNSSEALIKSNVEPNSIDKVILTHTHADHDTGLFQKILSGEKITIYTTKTVMDSWLYKYSKMAEIDIKKLSNLFHFRPVLIGEDINISGANFNFFYSFHSIPTLGFRFNFQNKTLVYSGDHRNDPEAYKTLYEKGYISKKRLDEFMNFPWESDIIFHEAGYPPLHTKISYLNSLPAKVQKKIYVYHIAKKDMPSQTHLNRLERGVDQTVSFELKKNDLLTSNIIISLLSEIDLFKNLDQEQLEDILVKARKKKFSQGDRIISAGAFGHSFYIIISGVLVVQTQTNDQKKIEKRYTRGQYLGEVAILQNIPRTVDVLAETDGEVLKLSRDSFFKLMEDDKIKNRLTKIARNRDAQSWEALSKSALFNKLSLAQKTNLEIILEKIEAEKEVYLLKIDQEVSSLYLYHSGEIKINQKGKESKKVDFNQGDIIGNYKEFKLSLTSKIDCIASKGAILFRIPKNSFLNYVRQNPGVYLRFFQILE